MGKKIQAAIAWVNENSFDSYPYGDGQPTLVFDLSARPQELLDILSGTEGK